MQLNQALRSISRTVGVPHNWTDIVIHGKPDCVRSKPIKIVEGYMSKYDELRQNEYLLNIQLMQLKYLRKLLREGTIGRESGEANRTFTKIMERIEDILHEMADKEDLSIPEDI
ncbi:unnamed protein product [Nezara viridula]|uniref:Uncharacterized protein n=1 Tax=Nezara viridula TaxID=85310 RepID=A0A9P0HLU9_NEZVI|nr:unnamed protein product [Nezara viridula]